MISITLLGNSCIALAIGFSIFGIIFFYAARQAASAVTGERSALLGRAAVYANFVLMTIANLAMVRGLLTNDFSISYVAHVGARETPRWISAISLWSSLEGSILFWGWILATYSAICIYVYRERKENNFLWVGLTLLAVQIFFYLLLALPANPFQPMIPPPANGPGPNPLLQNHWLMAIHPPCLYLGYIGFTIPFAFAIGALMENDRAGNWVRLIRRWTLWAWSFLSMAIVLGGWWSYAVLGWGGYWAWDPVENASFMPWLAGTALLHSIMVQEKRRLLAVWNLALACLTFLLTILGTFLTRSGILDSVHSFTESSIGPYFLVFIGITLAVSASLLLWKGPNFREPGRFENLLSLEVLFLFNNLLFLSFCFIVFLGTFYPLVVEAVSHRRISIGQPYFNQMTIPIVGMILLLMGIGLVTPWKKGTWIFFKSNSTRPAIAALLTTLLAFLLGTRHLGLLVVLLLASFAFWIMLLETLRVGLKTGPWRLLRANPRRYGGFIAHTGALILIVAVGFSKSYGTDQEINFKKGESVMVQDYRLTFEGMEGHEAPQRFEVKAIINVMKGTQSLGPLTPQMNYYPNSAQPIGSPSVRSTFAQDLYLTLIHFEKNGGAASIRAIVTPAVSWIWIGGGIVMLGGLLAL